MKILIVQPGLIWRGAETSTVNLALGLKGRGHKVKIVTLYTDYHYLPQGYAKLTIIKPSRFWQRVMMKRGLIFSLFAFWQLLYLTLVNSNQDEILVASNIPATWVIALVGKLKSMPLVWLVRDVPDKIPWVKRSSFSEYIVWLISSSFIDRFLGQGYDFIISNSKLVHREIKKRYHRDSFILYPPVSPFFLRPEKKRRKLYLNSQLNSKFVILSASHMHYYKNQTLAIDAFMKVLPKIPHALLVIAGGGPDEKKLRSIVIKKDLRGKVIFTGILKEKQLKDLYCQAAVTLVTSIKEPWSKIPFEALACNAVSVVSSKAGSSAIINKHKIGIVADPSVSTFSKKILYIFSNQALVDSMGKKGQRWVRDNLNIKNYAKNCERIFIRAIT